jgi:hypothetical protein
LTGPAGLSGPQGPLAALFEDGLRLLAAALAIGPDPDRRPAAVTSVCGAIRCFLKILESAADRRLPDPGSDVARLRAQCEALLDPGQDSAEVLPHALEAARLARDAAARTLALMPPAHGEGRHG